MAYETVYETAYNAHYFSMNGSDKLVSSFSFFSFFGFLMYDVKYNSYIMSRALAESQMSDCGGLVIMYLIYGFAHLILNLGHPYCRCQVQLH